MANRATRWAQRVHRWLGILGGAFVFVIAVTGAILVFRIEIDRWLTPGVPIAAAGDPLPLDAVVARWQARHPDAVLASLQYPIDGYGRRDWSAPYELWAGVGEAGERRWLLNPFTAGTIPPPAVDLGWLIRQVHVSLFAIAGPRWLRVGGLVLVGLIGVALVLSIATGLILHRRRLLRELLRLRRDGSRRLLLSDLHKRLAVWALLFHLLSALTGAFLGLEVLWWLSRPDAAAAEAPPGPAPQLAASLDDLVAAATRAIPDAEPLRLVLPRRDGEPVTVDMRNASRLIHHWSSTVALDSATAAPREVYDAANAGFWARLYFMIEPLHFGYYGGLPLKIAYAVLALALAALPVTGLVLWGSRRAARRRPASVEA